MKPLNCLTTTIGDIAESVRRVPKATPIADIKAIFQGADPITAIVVMDSERISGLVMDFHLDKCLSQRYGFSLYYKRPVAELMDRFPLIADAGEAVEEVAAKAMARESSRLYDHILITEKGRLKGIVQVKKILNTLVAFQRIRTSNLTYDNQILEKEVEERKRANTELRASRRMLQLVIDTIPHAVFWKDRNNVYLGCNKTFARDAGFGDPSLIIGRTDNDLPWPPDQARAFMDVDRGLMADGTRMQNHHQPLTTSDGRRRQIHTSKIPLYDSDEKVVGILCFYEDITRKLLEKKERQQLENKLLHSKKMEAVGRLAGGVAHDLNNILSAIVSYPELLLMDLDPESPMKRPLESMQNSGERAVAIVQDLLTMARRGVVNKDRLDINHVVNDYLATPEAKCLKREFSEIRITKRLCGEPLYVEGSQVHLMKTLMNLVNNSVEAIDGPGGIVIATGRNPVTVTNGTPQFAVLSVSDSGKGLSEEEQEKIFEPFYTRKKMGRSGTGLGMSVVWGTVKDHNGHIDIKSDPGQGTRVSIRIPVVKGKDPNVSDHVNIDDIMGKGQLVAVVDDRVEQREIAGRYLNHLNYRVKVLESGEAAVAFFKSGRADLVLLDMVMDPGINGLETYERILEEHPGQRAIIASGYSGSGCVQKALALGAGAYLKKPYHLKTLGMAVRKELDHTPGSRSKIR